MTFSVNLNGFPIASIFYVRLGSGTVSALPSACAVCLFLCAAPAALGCARIIALSIVICSIYTPATQWQNRRCRMLLSLRRYTL